jgi:protein O-GlcNAc transferase
VRLGSCYQPNDPDPVVTATPGRAAAGLPAEAMVFACFNVAHKIDPDSFALWCRILDAVPNGVLWLLETNPTATRNLRAEAATRGIDPSRLIFAPFRHKPDHLARLGLADLALDPGICNGHTTTTDALWSGVPVLTRMGRHFASRVAASLDTAAGLEGFIAKNDQKYVDKALFFATHPDKLAADRQRLIAGRDTLALFNTAALARQLEAAYHAMWTRHQKGQPAAAMELR